MIFLKFGMQRLLIMNVMLDFESFQKKDDGPDIKIKKASSHSDIQFFYQIADYECKVRC